MAGLVAGRGTCSAGEYAGVAPEASIIAIKASENGLYTFARVEAALRVALDAHVDLIYLAAGFDKEPTPGPWVWPGRASITELLDEINQSGVICFSPAGNEGLLGPGTVNFPGCASSMFSVGACDLNGRVWPHSSQGPAFLDSTAERLSGLCAPAQASRNPGKPEFVALGLNTMAPLSSGYHGSDAPTADPSGRYTGGTGTSEAAAIATGLAACALEWIETRIGLPRSACGAALRSVITEAVRGCPLPARFASHGVGVLTWAALKTALAAIPPPQ